MTVRHMILAGGAILLAGLGVYLFFEVRKAPAQPPPPVATKTAPEPAAKAPAPVLAADNEAPTPPPPPPVAPPRPVVDNGEHVPTSRIPVFASPLASARGANAKLEAMMDEANKAYDRGEYEEAKSIATKALIKMPSNSRMLRILVSAACMEGDSNEAQRHYNQLPPSDRAQMKVRCERYGVTFTEPPAQ